MEGLIAAAGIRGSLMIAIEVGIAGNLYLEGNSGGFLPSIGIGPSPEWRGLCARDA
jgi:hypothetical protein